MPKVIVTGAAGFIGFHVARRLLADGVEVIGADNLNDYYEVSLKEARLAQLISHTISIFSSSTFAIGPRSRRCLQTSVRTGLSTSRRRQV